ncbi:hypothetical protein HPB51_010717 [Rhipicephalus microplus]|uniref:HTH CENPB-type domain-containing protein n=1 Tax=Rhipicephalus microplus TaxID=6941 RepID=A0A9J6DUI4_RHIMP|nr:hypothetical protein HPB51_010717 [Rhipicephalus microplus]
MVLKNKQKVLDKFQQSFSSQRKRVQGSTFSDVEVALMVWLRNARAAKLPRPTAKADTLTLQIEHMDFSCSSNWFAHFKNRNRVIFQSEHGERCTVDAATADNWRGSQLVELRESYADSDIFNLYEAALFYKMLPSQTFTSKSGACSGVKQQKDRVTVLFGSTGSTMARILLSQREDFVVIWHLFGHHVGSKLLAGTPEEPVVSLLADERPEAVGCDDLTTRSCLATSPTDEPLRGRPGKELIPLSLATFDCRHLLDSIVWFASSLRRTSTTSEKSGGTTLRDGTGPGARYHVPCSRLRRLRASMTDPC